MEHEDLRSRVLVIGGDNDCSQARALQNAGFVVDVAPSESDAAARLASVRYGTVIHISPNGQGTHQTHTDTELNLQEAVENLTAANEELAAANEELRLTTEELNREIEERRRAEIEVRSMALFPNENPNPVIRISANGELLYSNPASAPLLECWAGDSEFCLPDYLVTEAIDALRSGTVREIDLSCNDRTFSFVLAPIANQGYVNLYGRDITKRVRAEQSLSEREAQLRTAFENITEGLVVADLKGHLYYWNPAAIKMHGFIDEEEGQRHLTEFTCIFELSEVDGTVLPLEKWPLARILQGETLRDWEVRIRRINTDWEKIFNYGGTLVRDRQGNALLAVVTINDITERRKAEEHERELESHKREFYQRTILAATEGKLVITEKASIDERACDTIKSWSITDNDSFGVMRDEINQLTLASGLDEPTTYQFLGCIVEAAGNAVKHANGGEARLCRTEDSLIFVISDTGPGIGALAIPDVALTRNYSTAGTLGMGYKLMIKFADRVYLSTGPEGTTVAVEMRLKRPSSASA